eukprot:scaffold9598_cov85-Skeletonema_dohrnii-CCMP3373.AAC.1
MTPCHTSSQTEKNSHYDAYTYQGSSRSRVCLCKSNSKLIDECGEGSRHADVLLCRKRVAEAEAEAKAD